MSKKAHNEDLNTVQDEAAESSDVSSDESVDSAGKDSAAAVGTADQPAADQKENTFAQDALQQCVAELKEENSELKDKYLRKHAEFENFRKRMMREKEDFAKYANQQLLADLVNVIDDFERAISSSTDADSFQSFRDGIVMIEKQLVNMLETKYHLERFEGIGEEFDPQRHEAVASAPADEKQDVSRVEEVYQKGYMLHDRVLRSAKVKVSMPGS